MNRPGRTFLRVILHPLTRSVLAWLAALGLTGIHYYQARHIYDNDPNAEPAQWRADGNVGHTTIDFGGQWIMGRMLRDGHARQLYHRDILRDVLSAWYPPSDQAPKQERSDVEHLMFCFMGSDTPNSPGEPAIGGPLYPPLHAFLYAPLAGLPPRPAYRLAQIIFLALGWLAALGLSVLSRGRVWWPVAASFVLLYPGFQGAIHLAQNSPLTLTILVWGWVLAARSRPLAGGMVWGLLADKPVWAAAFLLVPLLTRRWRMAAGMIGVGILLVLATLPVVGLQTWLDWWQVGRIASAIYKVDQNWIFLSRDLLGIPRRWMLDFNEGYWERNRRAAAVVGWAMLLSAFAATAIVAWFNRRKVMPPDGVGSAFVLLGAWLCCFHFMFYDELLSSLGVFVLLQEPRRFLRPVIVVLGEAPAQLAAYFRPTLDEPPPDPVPVSAGPRTVAVLNSLVLTLVVLLIAIEHVFPMLGVGVTATVGFLPAGKNLFVTDTGGSGPPWDTLCLIALWAWCGMKVVWNMDDLSPEGAGCNSQGVSPHSHQVKRELLL